jgi:PTH2 family peptidyl-tRNA hydrolase
MDNELIQYFIINSDLNMSPDKVAVSVAHVATLVAIVESNPANGVSKNFYDWYYHYDQKKIVLRGKQKDLEKLFDEGFYHVNDLGLTEVPQESLTCIGLGVMWKSEAQKYIKRLQLL